MRDSLRYYFITRRQDMHIMRLCWRDMTLSDKASAAFWLLPFAWHMVRAVNRLRVLCGLPMSCVCDGDVTCDGHAPSCPAHDIAPFNYPFVIK